GFMLIVGLPLICLLTFQLVKDMAVYEMSTAMTPASQFLEKAAAEEIKIVQLNAELSNQIKDEGGVKAVIEEKKADRDRKLAELAAKQAKAKAELEESLKRNDATRTDAITLTDYQKKELSEVEARQAKLIQQFTADTEQLNKAITDLRARRETELSRATTWNAEEARIENAYKAKLADYTNRKTAYEKDKAEYDSANFLKRQLMKEPVDPGVPPERESNKILKPTLVAELEAQIKAKEAELVAVNNKRRDSVAQVDADARKLREDFDRRSGSKREETDRKREELLAAMALLVKEGAAEATQIDQAFAAAIQKEEDTLKSQRPLEAVRAELDASRKKADGFYEAREAAIKDTQVHRIATTVEIVRGLLFGERPMSIKASAKERGDVLTDQISMVRIWVYPVLAFIVAFLPTLMVEIGFSTVFKPEQQRPAHRLGFLGRRLHWLYTRAGRQKILRAERLAGEASAEIAARDEALAVANAAAEKAQAEKEAEAQAARWAVNAAAAEHEEKLKDSEDRHKEELQKKEDEWVAKFSGMADSLNRAIIEKDALRDLQKSEIERQIQMRQNAWSDRLTNLRQELDEQRASSEAERTALIQEHHKKLMEISEDCKTQVIQIRRQMADAELAAVETSARLAHDLKEALHVRDTAESQLKHQADLFSRQLSQVKDEAARETEKAARQEKHRLERQQSEFEKTLRQHDEDFEHRLQQREQELSLAFDARLVEEKNKVEQDFRRRETELERQLEARARDVDARWNQEIQQREDAAQIRLKQREQQLQAQTEVRLGEMQTQTEQERRRQELEFERQLDARSREAETRLREELQQKELTFHAKLKQREQELTTRAATRETELQNKWASDLRAREEEWDKQAESCVRAAETRLGHEAQQKEEIFQIKMRQREQQFQSQLDARQAELKAQWDQELHEREQEWQRNAEAGARATESRWMSEIQQKEELFQSKARQRDQQWQAKLDNARAELQAQNEQELRRREVESAEARSRALREMEANLHRQMQENQEAAQAEIKQREQDLVAQLNAQAEAHQVAEKKWETELEIMRSNIEPFNALLARMEQERDEARQSASEGVRQVHDMEKKLTEASSLLTGWKSGKHLPPTRVGRDAFKVARGGLGASGEPARGGFGSAGEA
ncbi:MAG TPA: hypothetical protein VNT99_05985, partial [Methylomirabilota bacterium]|nr:hypothetical protein [Methylomirabilota bacterium]